LAGQSIARALLTDGAPVLLTDRNRPPAVDELVVSGARFVAELASVPDGVGQVVTSPGWPPDHPLFLDARARGVEVLGEVEFAWRLRRPGAPPWLTVTGTNGKTTTVRMLESILRTAGKRTRARL